MALSWFTAGYLVPALVIGGLLVANHISNYRWSGASPLGMLVWIPIAFAVQVSLFAAVTFIRRPKSSNRVAAAGAIGGAWLMLLPVQTASLFTGIEVPMLAIVALCVVALLYTNGEGRTNEL